MKRVVICTLVALLAACASSTGSGASPGGASTVAGRARSLTILPSVARACPGDLIDAKYDAQLTTGEHVSLGDRDVASLVRRGMAASPAGNGAWQLSGDALASAASGFRLSAALQHDTTVHADTTIRPEYGCHRTAWQLPPSTGFVDEEAHIRIGVLPSPFYDSVVVAVFENSKGGTSVVLLSPSEMKSGVIHIDAPGRTGANGRGGRRGENGEACGNGGDGDDGDVGGDGGPGGVVDIIAEAGAEWLANLVSVSNAGGRGGSGGQGGAGGAAGQVSRSGSTPCSPRPGRNGHQGRDGAAGPAGRPSRVTTVPRTLLWSGSPIWANEVDRASIEKMLTLPVR